MASPRDDEEYFAIPSGASFCGPGKTDIAQHQHQAFRGPECQQASPYNTNSYMDHDGSSKDCEEDDFVSESDLATATCKGDAVVYADDDGNVDKNHHHDENDDDGDSEAFADDSNYDDDSEENDDENNGQRCDDQLGKGKVVLSDSEENGSDENEHRQNDRPTGSDSAFFTALSDDESSDEIDENALFSRHHEELKLQAKGEAATRPVARETGPSRIHAERSYYDGLPFGPGPGMLFHLQPLSSKPKSSLTRKHASGAGVENGLRRHRRDGVLHVRMPDTAVFGRQGRRVLLRFSSKAQGMVASSLEADAWEETLCKKWLAEARPVGVEHEPIVAVLKFPSWLHVEGSETRLVNAATLLGRLEQRPNICVVQRFVNPKGAKPSVYRATWRRDKLPIVVNITASRTFREASRDAHARQDADVFRHGHGQLTQNSNNQNENSSDERLVTVPQAQHFFEERLLSEWFCPGSADTDKTTIFKVANVAVSQVREALTRIVRHLEASIGREYGLRKFAFEQLQCDLMRSKSDEWILTNVRGFELTPEAYREAHQVELEIRHRREAQGDYYDSEDEEVHNKQRRQYARRQHGYERNGARSLRANGTRRLCAMCSRPILSDEKVPGRPHVIHQVSTAASSAVEQFPTVSEATSAERSDDISASEQKRNKPDNSKQKKSGEPAAKTNFEMTSVLARGLRTQLMLRGRRVVAFDNCLFARNESRFENGILVPGSSAAVGNSFQVCKLCHALWEANETLVHTGKEIGASWLPQNIRVQKNHGNQARSPTQAETPAKASRSKVNARKKKANVKDPTTPSARALLERVISSGQDARAHADSERNGKAGQTEVRAGDLQPRIIIPGAPSYGAKPGSRAGYVFCGSEEDMYRPKTESLKMTCTTAGVAAAKDARETKLNPAHARLQFRLAIFVRDIVGLPGETLDLQYRFHPWAGAVSIPVSRGTRKDAVCTVRQLRIHYFMASRVGLQQLFMQPLVIKLLRHEGDDQNEMPQSIEYHGELFLTRFLASFARHSLVNFDLRLHPSSGAASDHGEAPLLRCAIGIIRDGLHLTELDPGMPLAVDGAVLHLPPNYFDVRALPESWISSIVAGQQQLASKSDDDGDKRVAQGTGNGQGSDDPPGTLPSTDVCETRPSQRWQAQAARRSFEQGRETERLHAQPAILKETSQVIQEVVATGHAGAGLPVVLDSAEAWEQAAAFFEDVQEVCEDLPVSRATLIAEAMKRAKNQNHANKNLRDDAQGTSETETTTTSLLAQSAGATAAGDDELDWATIVAMLQDPRMKTFADDAQDGDLSRIARRRASECMVFTKDTFLLYLQHRAKELALQTSSLVPHEDGVEVQATEKTSEGDNASAAKAWSLGLFSRRVKKDAVVRRYLRFRAYARIWACIDIDQNGRLDAAELRAYVRQRQSLEDPRAIYSKAFADWSLREMHAHFCMWLGASARANEKFERYDVDASGLISWEEFVNMADRAFRDEALDEISFSVSQGYGECPRHGKTRVYSIDLSCVACEIAKHDPSRAWDQDLLTNLNPEILSKVKTAAGRMLRRLSYGVHDDMNPLLSREQEPSQSSRSILDMLSPSMHTLSDAPGSKALHSRTPSRQRTAERKRAGLTNVEEEYGDSDDDDRDESREGRIQEGTSKEGIVKKLQKRASKDGRRQSGKMPTEGTPDQDLTRATSSPRLQLGSLPSFKSSIGSNSKRRMTKTPKRKKTLNKTGQRQSVKVNALAPLRKSGPSVVRQRPLDRIGESHIERLSHHHTVNTRPKRKTRGQRSTISANLSFLDALSTEVATFRDAGRNESYVCTTPSNCSKRGGTKRKALRPSRSASQLMSARPVRSSPSEPGESEASEAKSLRSQQAAERKESLALLHDAEVETLLVYAKFGNVHQARRLLAQGKVKPSAQLHGRLPLHEAAAAGQREMAELLLASGARADATDAEGLTAAQVAAQAGHGDFAAWLSSR